MGFSPQPGNKLIVNYEKHYDSNIPTTRKKIKIGETTDLCKSTVSSVTSKYSFLGLLYVCLFMLGIPSSPFLVPLGNVSLIVSSPTARSIRKYVLPHIVRANLCIRGQESLRPVPTKTSRESCKTHEAFTTPILH